MSVGDTVKWADVPVGALFYVAYSEPNIGLRAQRDDGRTKLWWIWERYFQGGWQMDQYRSGPWPTRDMPAVVVLALDVDVSWSAWQFKRAALDGAKVAGIADELAQDGGPFAPGSWPQV